MQTDLDAAGSADQSRCGGGCGFCSANCRFMSAPLAQGVGSARARARAESGVRAGKVRARE